MGDEQAFKSSDPEFMQNFMALLDNRNISYRYGDGYIRYKNDVKSQVKEVENLLSHTKSTQFKNKKVREYFRSLLDEEGIEYLALNKDGDSWTMWWANDDEKEQEIQLKVVEFAFENNKHRDM